jgi:hypothetical protein
LVNALSTALNKVLSVSAERRQYFAYAIAVHKSENWIMASVKSCPESDWQTADAKTALRALFDPSKYSSIKAMRDKFLADLSADTALLTKRAKSYRLFVDDLEATPSLQAT